MTNQFILHIKDVYGFLVRSLRIDKDVIALILIAVAITLPSIAPLSSGDKANYNDDFFYYAAKHEAVRKAILEYHTFPTRVFWSGGGYPVIGDPQDPTLNPLTLITVVFGSIMGVKIIIYISLLIGGLSTYLLTRYIWGYTRWGSLFSGLLFGLSPYIPFLIYDGNINDIYIAFIPLCLLLIGLVCRGKKVALFILPFVFYVMLSDGRTTSLMSFIYIGMICLMDIFPYFNIFGTKEPNKIGIKPLKVFLLAMILTFFIGMLRILPILDLVLIKGSLGKMFLWFHPQVYSLKEIIPFTFLQMWNYLIGHQGILHFMTIGLIPVLLSLSAFLIFPRKTLPWLILLFLFVWLELAYYAPVDLFKLLWQLPIPNVISKPWKYFTFPIVFTLIMVGGQFFRLLANIRRRWLEHILAVGLIFFSILALYPGVCAIQKKTYTYDIPAALLVKQNEFYNVNRNRELILTLPKTARLPALLNEYTYLIRNIGVVDWAAAFIIGEKAIPKYFVDINGAFIPNTNYRGEAYFSDPDNLAEVSFRPNSIIMNVKIEKPDTLIINQNYDRDWHTNHGKILEKDGLIALQLNQTGSYKISMYYISRSFFTGLAISVMTLFILIFISWSYKTGRLNRWANHAAMPVRWLPRFILWLID